MKKFLGKVQEGLDKLDRDKRTSSHGAPPAVAAAASVPLTSINAPPTQRDIYLHRKQRGVNLGSWFSLESWLTPSLFQNAKEPKGSELDVVEGMDAGEAKAMLETHWDRFVDDGDWQWMVGHGINTVRIPVGYFHFVAGHPDQAVRSLLRGTDYERHASVYEGALSRIHNAIEKAKSHGIGVLVDLHGAPGAQNTDGHAGVSTGKAALWESSSDLKKTVQILVAMAKEYGRYENVVGLELLNEPKNSSKLQSFYDDAIAQIRAASPEAAALPLYLGDGWDTNHYTGYVGQRAGGGNFLVADYHLYRCFTPGDHSIRCEDHAAKIHPGRTPLPHDRDGCGDTAGWLQSMSHRCGHSLIVGEWSAALNPASLGHLGSPEDKKRAKTSWAHNQWLAYDKFCSGYFFWTLKKEGGPDTGWCLYTAVERGVMPEHLDPHRGRRRGVEQLEAQMSEAQQRASSGHDGYWNQQGDASRYEHWRFAEGFVTAWRDSVEFVRQRADNEIGFDGQWKKARTEAHRREKGQGSDMVWEFEHGFDQGLAAFKAALYG
ncbi:Glucan 1,3-beta-glucosidase 3 [Thecaphora frezii]